MLAAGQSVTCHCFGKRIKGLFKGGYHVCKNEGTKNSIAIYRLAVPAPVCVKGGDIASSLRSEEQLLNSVGVTLNTTGSITASMEL